MSGIVIRVADWPVPVAGLICAAMMAVTVAPVFGGLERSVPDGAPEPLPPVPEAPKVRYAPVPGWDDRTPIAFMDLVFGLGDPGLAAKLSGIGPVFWQGSGRGSGALIDQDLVLTTGHLFAKDGSWKGGTNLLPVPPHPSQGSIYLDACGQSYDFSVIELGSQSPRKNLGLDYAIARLDQPACPEARVLAPRVLTQDEVDGLLAAGPRLINMGVYPFSEVPRYAQHPLMTGKTARVDGMHTFHVFGVLCTLTSVDNTTGPLTDGPSGLYETEGCDGVPGGSGGPLLVSLDGGQSYQIIGVANSYRPNSEYNNYTQITGAFAAHLARVVPGFDARPPGVDTATNAPLIPRKTGPWVAMEEGSALPIASLQEDPS